MARTTRLKALEKLGYDIEHTPQEDDDVVILDGPGITGLRLSLSGDDDAWASLLDKKAHADRVEQIEATAAPDPEQ